MKYLYIFMILCFTNFSCYASDKNKEESMKYCLSFASEKDSLRYLKELVVTGREQKNTLQGAIYYPLTETRKHSNNGLDLLEQMMLPQIEVNRREKKIMHGDKEVTLKINGRVVRDNTEILELQPKDIIRIELQEIPTGADAEYNTVINYVVRHYKLGGYVMFNGNQRLKGQGDYLSMLRFSHNHAEYTVGYLFGYTANPSQKLYNSEKWVYPDATLLQRDMKQYATLYQQRNNNLFFNYNYQNLNNNINFKFGYKNNKVPHNENHSDLSYRGKYELMSTAFDTSEETYRNPYMSFSIDKKFKNDREINAMVDVNFSRNVYDRTYTEQEKEEKPSSLRTQIHENYLTTLTKIAYTRSFPQNWKMTILGGNTVNVSNKNYSGTGKDDLFSTETWFYPNITKLWTHFFLSLRLGAKFQFYKQENIRKHFIYPAPKLIFRFLPSENHVLQYAFYFGNFPPSVYLYNSTLQSIDFLQKKVGNPHLTIRKEYENNFSYTATFKNFNLYYYFEQYSAFPTYRESIRYDGTYFIHTYVNTGHWNYLDTYLTLGYSPFHNKLRLKMKFGVKGSESSGNNSMKVYYVYLSPMIYFYYKKLTLQLYYSSPSKGVWMENVKWTETGNYGFSLSYNAGNFSVSFSTDTPFSHYKRTERLVQDNYNYNKMYTDGLKEHSFYLSLSYHFTFGRHHTYTTINTDKNTNSAIMK